MSAARTATRTRPTTVGWIAIIIFVFLAGLGTIAALAAVAVFNSVNSNLAPPSKLTSYVLPEETIVYDRTGKIELARFGDAKREVVQFDEIPKVLLDATTAVVASRRTFGMSSNVTISRLASPKRASSIVPVRS